MSQAQLGKKQVSNFDFRCQLAEQMLLRGRELIAQVGSVEDQHAADRYVHVDMYVSMCVYVYVCVRVHYVRM